jgi:hypothetical protein
LTGRAHAIGRLIAEIDLYLARLDGEAENIAEVRRGIARFGRGPVNSVPPNPSPACGFLDEALAASDAPGLVRAIGLARPYLNWIGYDLYPRAEIGERFARAHAFATIVGPTAHIHADDFEIGLFLMAPGTLYRDHHHPAPELYVPLTGPHEWRFAPGGPWIAKPAHMPVWNEPNAIHATFVGDVPFLCLYAWTRDVNAPAKVDFAPDWAAIEASP